MSLLFGGKYVTPDRPDNYGGTPLSSAAENGRDGVVKLLLGRMFKCVNARGMIYSIWIILGRCMGNCEDTLSEEE